MSYKPVQNNFDFSFYLVLFFLFFEYGRPQNFFPVVGKLKPGMIIQVALLVCLIKEHKLFDLSDIRARCFLFLLLLMTIHVPLAVNNFWAYQMWRTITLYFIIFQSIGHFVNTPERLKRFVKIWVLINVVGAMIGIKHGGKIPNSGFMGDENDFALVMNMAIPFSYFMFLSSDSMKERVMYLTCVGIFVSANVSSLSRGGFIGLLPVVLYCLYKTQKKILSLLILSLVVGVLIFSAPPDYWKEMQTIKEENINKGTGYDRWYMWKCAWRMFLDNPVMGVGQGNFPWNIQKYEPSDVNVYWHSHAGRVAHSIYFTLISELGLIGSLLFGIMTFSVFRRTELYHEANIRNAQAEHQLIERPASTNLKYLIFGIRGALIGYMFSGAFLSVLYYPHFWILSGMVVGAARSETRRSKSEVC